MGDTKSITLEIIQRKKPGFFYAGFFFTFALMQLLNNQSKGRSSALISHRNQKLAARFYWYSCIIGFKFSKCLNHLEIEFDISQSRICDLISENAELISKHEREMTDAAVLKNKYPFMNWQFPAMKSHSAVQLSLGLF